MAEELDHRGYPVSPRKLGDEAWFYEDASGIQMCQTNGTDTLVTMIPWRKLESAVDRHRALKRKTSK